MRKEGLGEVEEGELRAIENEEVLHTTHFPIKEIPELVNEEYQSVEAIADVIVHYFRHIGRGKQWEKFKLAKKIGDLTYVLSLAEYDDKIYSFDFKTEEFEYALTQLSRAQLRELIDACIRFIEDASRMANGLKLIRGWGSPASYERSDIEACREAIFSSPNNRHEREDIMGLRGQRLFDVYRELFGKSFFEKNKKKDFGISIRRADLFAHIAERELPDWDVLQMDKYSGEVYLSRKEKDSETTTTGNEDSPR